MQSIYQSWIEIIIDFFISILLNYAIQAVFIQSFTKFRGLSFSALLLSIVIIRRYIIRRTFNQLVNTDIGQSRIMSFAESLVDTLIAIVIAFSMLKLWYPYEPLPRVTSVIVVSYLLTFGRRFILRRFFESWWRRQKGHTTAPSV